VTDTVEPVARSLMFQAQRDLIVWPEVPLGAVRHRDRCGRDTSPMRTTLGLDKLLRSACAQVNPLMFTVHRHHAQRDDQPPWRATSLH